MPVTFTARPDGAVRFAVRVQPRSSRACVDGAHGDAVRVRVHAAPVDGGANADVIAVLADALDVPKRDVRIVSGDTARQKVLEVVGLTADAVRARLLPTPLSR
jgi:uncharacterized protein (TIGR00251 family)